MFSIFHSLRQCIGFQFFHPCKHFGWWKASQSEPLVGGTPGRVGRLRTGENLHWRGCFSSVVQEVGAQGTFGSIGRVERLVRAGLEHFQQSPWCCLRSMGPQTWLKLALMRFRDLCLLPVSLGIQNTGLDCLDNGKNDRTCLWVPLRFQEMGHYQYGTQYVLHTCSLLLILLLPTHSALGSSGQDLSASSLFEVIIEKTSKAGEWTPKNCKQGTQLIPITPHSQQHITVARRLGNRNASLVVRGKTLLPM